MFLDINCKFSVIVYVLFENIVFYILILNGLLMDEDEGGLGRGGVFFSLKYVSV